MRNRLCAALLALAGWSAGMGQAVEPALIGGFFHGAALSSEGQVYTWGSDVSGQLGQGRKLFIPQASKVQFPGLPNARVKAMTAGDAHSAAILEDGSIWTWGDNFYGQLGNGTRAGYSVPVKIPGSSGLVAVSAGLAHTLALTSDGRVFAWGFNDNGELGDGKTDMSLSPVQTLNLPPITVIKAGPTHNIALAKDGSVWTWGDNSSGQLGDLFGLPRSTPGQVFLFAPVGTVSAGGKHSMALDIYGRVWAWGNNEYGQLGNGTTESLAVPGLVPGLDQVIAISAGTLGSLAVRADGSVWIWGYGLYGFATQSGEAGSAVDVEASVIHALFLRPDGKVAAGGANEAGQLGDGTTEAADLTMVKGISGAAKAIAAGSLHSMALGSDGTLWAWGSNAKGQLGEGAESERNVPSLVTNLNGVTALAAGDRHMLALKSDGSVWGWGGNFTGSVGDGSQIDRSSPVKLSGLSNIRKIGAGGVNSAAVAADGSVWTWGANGDGELGIGDLTVRYVLRPVKVPNFSGAVDISLGAQFVTVLRGDGTVWAWGNNYYGQLGPVDGTRDSPIQISGLTNIKALSNGAHHALALQADGTVWSWGANYWGQLGDGSDTPSAVPRPVPGLPRIKAISAGFGYSLALDFNGIIWGWGSNFEGELGLGDEGPGSTPIPMAAIGEQFAAIAAGSFHSMAMKSDGTVWSFGWNMNGQQGDGTFADRRSYGGVVNAKATGYLDLLANVANLPLPSDKEVPFFVETEKIGGDRDLSLAVEIKLSRTLAQQFSASNYNVYVGALVPQGNPPLQGNAFSASSWFIKDKLAGWGAYLGGPIPEFLSGVAALSADELVKIQLLSDTDLSNQIGTQFYVGYGLDQNEMLASRRYRVVYEVQKPR